MTKAQNDEWTLGGHSFTSRFILGSGKYSMDLIEAAVACAGAQIITLALRRVSEGGKTNILDYIPKGITLLPNTSGARNAEEAVRIARLAREAGCGDFVKIEVIRDSKYLLPDNHETIRATEILAKEGFIVMPYMYPDLTAARDLASAGAGVRHAARRTDWDEQGTLYERIYPDSDRRNRSARNRGRRHRAALAGLRSDGNGLYGSHGKYGHCDCR